MRVFDYACRECGDRFERFVRDAAERVDCPRCGIEVNKCLSAPGFKLDGTDKSLPRAARRWADWKERAGALDDG